MVVPDRPSFTALIILVLVLLFLPAGGSTGGEVDLHTEIKAL